LIGRRGLAVSGLAVAAGGFSARARAQGARPVRVGVLTDMTGGYADQAGPGSVEAARMAIEDAGGPARAELVFADHQNKPDIAAGIARDWYDQGHVDLITDMPNSAAALAVQQITRDRNKVAIYATAATTELTGKQCSPNGVQWVYDAYSGAAGLAKILVSQGRDTWFFITVDYALGASLQSEATKVILAGGGRVVGTVKHPLNNADFSAFLLEARSSGAKVICLADAGADTINALKQASEFGMNGGDQLMVAPLVYISDIHALGLKQAAGLTYVEGFYWDRDDDSRAWSKRFFARRNAMPTMTHAGVYSGVSHYLKAVQTADPADGRAVVAQMRATPVNDMFARNGIIREDGRMVHDMYLVQVKRPDQSRYPWDYYTILATIPGDQAFRSLADGECPLVNK
jgi:branched-chain amino acid transport system substrate-binding protein